MEEWFSMSQDEIGQSPPSFSCYLNQGVEYQILAECFVFSGNILKNGHIETSKSPEVVDVKIFAILQYLENTDVTVW